MSGDATTTRQPHLSKQDLSKLVSADEWRTSSISFDTATRGYSQYMGFYRKNMGISSCKDDDFGHVKHDITTILKASSQYN